MELTTTIFVLLVVFETYETLYTDIAAFTVHAENSVYCKKSFNALFARNATKSFNAKFAEESVNSMKANTARNAGEVKFAYKAKHATYAAFAMYAEHKDHQNAGQALNIGNSCPKENGSCVVPNGMDQAEGVVKLNVDDGNTTERQGMCLGMCHAYLGATGCEVIWNKSNRGCYVHTNEVARGNGVANHSCWIFAKCNEEKGKDEMKFTMRPGCQPKCIKIRNGTKCRTTEHAIIASVSAYAADCRYAVYTREAEGAANAKYAERAQNALYSTKAEFAKEAVNSTFARKAENATFAYYAEYAVVAKYFKKDKETEDPERDEIVPSEPKQDDHTIGEMSPSKLNGMEDFDWTMLKD